MNWISQYFRFHKREFHVASLVSVLLSLFILFYGFHLTTTFLTFNESRIGYKLFDPILSALPSIDLSRPIFVVTYTAIFIGLILSFTSIRDTVIAIQAITILLFLRIICMTMLPLEPPTDIVPLHDAFLTGTFYNGQILTKDLFFSGHTASVAILAYLIQHKMLSRIFFVVSFIVGSMLLLQHVHYTIDVAAAYLFAYVSYRFGVYSGDRSIVIGRFVALSLFKTANEQSI